MRLFKHKLKKEFNKDFNPTIEFDKIKEKLIFEKQPKLILMLTPKRLVMFSISMVSILIVVLILNFDINSNNNFNDFDKICSTSSDSYKNCISSLGGSDKINTKVRKLSTSSIEDKDELLKNGVVISDKAGYTTNYSNVETSCTLSETTLWGESNNQLIFPGSLLRVNNPDNNYNSYESFGLRTGNITISTDLYTSTGTNDNSVFRNIKNAKLSNTREAIKDILSSNLVEGAQLPYSFSSSISEITSLSELKLLIGINQSNIESSSINNMLSAAALSFKTNAKNSGAIMFDNKDNVVEGYEKKKLSTFVLVQLTQIYYNISVDPVYNPMEIINGKEKKSTILSMMEKSGIPAYVSNISYGRKAIVLIETSDTYEEFTKSFFNGNSNSLSLTNKNNMDLFLSDVENSCSGEDKGESNQLGEENEIEMSSIKNYHCYVVGGTQVSSSQTMNITSILKSFDEKYDPLKCIGVPISFSARYIDGSNSIVPIGGLTNYYTKLYSND